MFTEPHNDGCGNSRVQLPVLGLVGEVQLVVVGEFLGVASRPLRLAKHQVRNLLFSEAILALHVGVTRTNDVGDRALERVGITEEPKVGHATLIRGGERAKRGGVECHGKWWWWARREGKRGEEREF